MALERRRNGRLFYYRSRRAGDRVVKEYIGGGEKGRQAAEADQAARDARGRVKQKAKERNRPLIELASELDVFGQIIDHVVSCQLLCAGWRKHHREWRPNHDRSRTCKR